MPRDLIREYLNYLQIEKGLSLHSIKGYERDLRRLTVWARQQNPGKDETEGIASLEKSQLALWLASLTREGLNPRSVARALSAARGFYKFLQLDGHLKTDPTAELAPPVAGNKIPRFLTISEVDLLLNAPDVDTLSGLRNRAILEFLYASGMRVSELLSLKINDLDREKGVIKCTGKGSRQRRVPIGKSALHWFERYQMARVGKNDSSVGAHQKKSDWLFTDSNGAQLNRQKIWGIVKEYALQLSLEHVTPHTLRHSFATHLMQRGADSRSVQALLGHTDLSTTQIYTHITDQRLREMYNKHHPRAGSE